jgi:hypothetical protein
MGVPFGEGRLPSCGCRVASGTKPFNRRGHRETAAEDAQETARSSAWAPHEWLTRTDHELIRAQECARHTRTGLGRRSEVSGDRGGMFRLVEADGTSTGKFDRGGDAPFGFEYSGARDALFL